MKQRHVVINDKETKQQRGKAAVFMWRVFSGIVAAGGAGTGFFINTLVDKKIAEYNTETEAWQKYLSNQKESVKMDDINKETETINNLHSTIESYSLYRNVCYGAAGIGGISLTFSIVLPIIVKK